MRSLSIVREDGRAVAVLGSCEEGKSGQLVLYSPVGESQPGTRIGVEMGDLTLTSAAKERGILTSGKAKFTLNSGTSFDLLQSAEGKRGVAISADNPFIRFDDADGKQRAAMGVVRKKGFVAVFNPGGETASWVVQE